MISVAKMFVEEQRRLLGQIRRRMEQLLSQMSEADLAWRPDPQARSMADLVLHMCGSLRQGYMASTSSEQDAQSSQKESLQPARRRHHELLEMIAGTFGQTDEILQRLPLASLFDSQETGGRSMSLLEMASRCSAEASEDLGQAILLARLRLGQDYREYEGEPAG